MVSAAGSVAPLSRPPRAIGFALAAAPKVATLVLAANANRGDAILGFSVRPRRRPDRRHHLRDRRHRLVDHADAGADLSIWAETGGTDHGGRRRDGEFFP